ncbi:MAG: N-acetylmuramoyl-L-alanine amidase [Lachnospiraceae bacterium]|nr:N-acetylmuramoyl-L-alanine amidase [Lachnospiraceae bacterium]
MREFRRGLARGLAQIYVFFYKYKFICAAFVLLLFLLGPAAIRTYRHEMKVKAAGELMWENMVCMEHASEDYLADWLIVMVDAGHGGKDPGAIYGDIYEKDITLSVANLIAALLEPHKIKVIMTRDEDVFVDKYDRAYMANKEKADLFISIHVNDLAQTSHSGIETYYGLDKTDGQQFAEYIHNAVLKNTHAVDQGTKSAGYVVVKYTVMPSALLEIGYMSNPEEREKLQSAAYRQMLAEGIANGIIEYAEDVLGKTEPK